MKQAKQFSPAKVRSRMAALGLTQAALLDRMLGCADDIRPNRQWLYQVLNDKIRSPGVDHVFLMAAALECRVEDLGE